MKEWGTLRWKLVNPDESELGKIARASPSVCAISPDQIVICGGEAKYGDSLREVMVMSTNV